MKMREYAGTQDTPILAFAYDGTACHKYHLHHLSSGEVNVHDPLSF